MSSKQTQDVGSKLGQRLLDLLGSGTIIRQLFIDSRTHHGGVGARDGICARNSGVTSSQPVFSFRKRASEIAFRITPIHHLLSVFILRCSKTVFLPESANTIINCNFHALEVVSR